jgi:hypothetical protein
MIKRILKYFGYEKVKPIDYKQQIEISNTSLQPLIYRNEHYIPDHQLMFMTEPILIENCKRQIVKELVDKMVKDEMFEFEIINTNEGKIIKTKIITVK